MKKIRLYIIAGLLICLFSKCDKGNESKSKINECEIDSELALIFDDFCNEGGCNSCINEFFIDRINADSTIMTLRSERYIGEKYMPNYSPLCLVTNKGYKFYIFTGAENFLKKNSRILEYSNSTTHKCNEEIWTIINYSNQYKIIKHGGEPFAYSIYLKDSLNFFLDEK